MVRYNNDDLSVHDEWVFNGADIDGSKIVLGARTWTKPKRKTIQVFQRPQGLARYDGGRKLVFRPYEKQRINNCPCRPPTTGPWLQQICLV